MRRILITGGMGYVGGRTAIELANRTDLSIILGSRQTQEPPIWLPRSAVLSMDWWSIENLMSVCEGVETVVHLAAMNDVECGRNPVGALEVNGVNTVRLLEAAKACKVRRFIYLSTAHVYGSPLAGGLHESVLPNPKHPYATSHRAAEDAVLAVNNGPAGIVLRLSNGLGAPAHADVNCWTLLVNDLCRQAVTDGRLTLRSAGLQCRDFITLHDVGRVISHMLDMPAEQLGTGIFNVGSGKAMRVIDMAELIQSRCASVLSFTPDILRPEPNLDEISLRLDYSIDKLTDTGFFLQGKITDEIDATLLLCQSAFGKK